MNTQDGRLLMYAARVGDITLVRRLLASNLTLANYQDPRRFTPLHTATTMEVVRLLLRHGASPHSRHYDEDGDDRLPEETQTASGRYEIAEFIAHCRREGYERGQHTFTYKGTLRRRAEEERREWWPSGPGVGIDRPRLGTIGRVHFLMKHFTEERPTHCEYAIWHTYLLEAQQAMRDGDARGSLLDRSLTLSFPLAIAPELVEHPDPYSTTFPRFIIQGLEAMCREWGCTLDWKVTDYETIVVILSHFVRSDTSSIRTTVLGMEPESLAWHVDQWEGSAANGHEHLPAQYIAHRLERFVSVADAGVAFNQAYYHTFAVDTCLSHGRR